MTKLNQLVSFAGRVVSRLETETATGDGIDAVIITFADGEQFVIVPASNAYLEYFTKEPNPQE